MKTEQPKTPLVYVLHSGNLYGTERMALYTAAGLASVFDPVILAPEGLAIEEARACGFQARVCDGILALSSAVRSMLSRNLQLAYISTGVIHSALCLAWNMIYRRRVRHLHLVHGGACERLSYGRKQYLNHFPVQFVAVSAYVRDRLVAHGVKASRIQVIENFLPESQVKQSKRLPFNGEPPCRLIVISRLDPEKRVSLLLDALEQSPDLLHCVVRVFGSGWEMHSLRERAAKKALPVIFEGFCPDIRAALVGSDILVHLCPEEPFGLAIIEATAAGVPVLVPDSGGAGLLVDDKVTGFRFRANDAASLADCLRQILALGSESLNQVAARAQALHATRFSAHERISEYKELLLEGLT